MCSFTASKISLGTCLIQHALQSYVHLIPPQIHTLNFAEAALVIIKGTAPFRDKYISWWKQPMLKSGRPEAKLADLGNNK